MENHRCGKNQVIDKAIQKYGFENFKEEILDQNISEAEAKEKEKQYIEHYNTQVPNGYNITSGGDYKEGIEKELSIQRGCDNGRALLTEDEVVYIKNNRDLPMMYLYSLYIGIYGDSVSYEVFKKVYNDQTYKNIKPTVEKYPYNSSFSNMMRRSALSISEIIDLRDKYNQIVYWKDAYEPYKNRLCWESFWQLYNGFGAKGRLIMPEVFTEENKKQHTLLKGQKNMTGEKNPKAKLTIKDVKDIRKLYDSKHSFKELYKLYPQVTQTTIRDICHRKTWKNI